MKLTEDGLLVEVPSAEWPPIQEKFLKAGFKWKRGPCGLGLYSPSMDRMVGEIGEEVYYLNPGVLYVIGVMPDDLLRRLLMAFGNFPFEPRLTPDEVYQGFIHPWDEQTNFTDPIKAKSPGDIPPQKEDDGQEE